MTLATEEKATIFVQKTAKSLDLDVFERAHIMRAYLARIVRP